MANLKAAERVIHLADSHWGLNEEVRNSLRVVAKASIKNDESDEVKALKQLICHMNVHSGYENNGYWKMTIDEKQLYDDVWAESVAKLDAECESSNQQDG